jgi:hypothetical protein
MGNSPKAMRRGLALTLYAAIGLALGSAMGNAAIGLCLGLALCLLVGDKSF